MIDQLNGARRPVTPDPRADAALRAVGEALAAGRTGDPAAGGAAERLAAACGDAGRALAAAGVPLGEALDALAGEWGSRMGCDPSFPAVRAFADAWGDDTLAWLHRLECVDPMTGLAGPGHLRTRVGEVLRGVARGSPTPAGHALVVADLPPAGPDPFADALLTARADVLLRSVFCGDETVAALGGGRLGVLVAADPCLPRRAALLERMLAATTAGPDRGAGDGRPRGTARVRVLPLPADAAAAHLLLDELLDRPGPGAAGLTGGATTA